MLVQMGVLKKVEATTFYLQLFLKSCNNIYGLFNVPYLFYSSQTFYNRMEKVKFQNNRWDINLLESSPLNLYVELLAVFYYYLPAQEGVIYSYNDFARPDPKVLHIDLFLD